MTDQEVLAVAESIKGSTSNPAVEKVMAGVATFLAEKAKTEKMNRWMVIVMLAVFGVAILKLWAELGGF